MLKNFLTKLNNVVKHIPAKVYYRSGLALLSVVAITVGFVFVNDYTVVDGSKTYSVKTYADSVAGVLNTAGLNVKDEDRVNMDKNVITVDRTYSYVVNPETLLAAGQISESVIDYTNEQLFDNKGVGVIEDNTVEGLYTVNPCTVEHVYETVTRTIKYGHKTVKSSDMLKGERKVTKGKNGEKEVVLYKTVVNGVVVDSKVHSEKVITEAVPEIETVGTRVVYNSSNAVMTSADVKSISTLAHKPIELDKNGIPVSYAKVISGKASAYWPGEDGGEYCSTGVKAQPGYVAVNPKQIPYGTKMYIVSADGKYVYGYAIAADTGGFAYNGSGRIVDLRFPSKSSGSAFGVRKVNIYILD
jgi:3D (Asp-Asp-Asp) domain-containing protein